MSLITNKIKVINSGLQVGTNGTIAKDIRYFTYNYGSIPYNSDVIINNLSLGTTPMSSIPLMFGNVTDQTDTASPFVYGYMVIVSFFSITTSSYSLILRNNNTFFASNSNLKISIMAVSL